MLAYRHAFHAGNHADVLKHTVLTLLLRYMNGKDKPYRVIDTHAGAGGYSLEGRYAKKKGEFEQGIGRLWARDDLPEAVADYVERVREFNPQGTLEQYPGLTRLSRRCCCDPRTSCASSSSTRPITASLRPTLARRAVPRWHMPTVSQA